MVRANARSVSATCRLSTLTSGRSAGRLCIEFVAQPTNVRMTITAALEIIAIPLGLTRMLDRGIDHSLNTVTIGVDDKCGVVVLSVLGTQAGRPVVLPTMLQSRGVETRYGLARWGGECDMETRTRRDDSLCAEFDGQLVTAVRLPITDGRRVAPHPHIAQRRKHCIVEGGGTVKIGDAEREVMQHAGGGLTLRRSRDRPDQLIGHKYPAVLDHAMDPAEVHHIGERVRIQDDQVRELPG